MTIGTDAPDLELRPVGIRPSLPGRLLAVWHRWELLANLVSKELKVKYQSSVLGFAWSLVTPLLYLVVFSGVFQFVLRVDLPRFALFLVTGLIIWNLFSAAVSGATTAISGSPDLIKRVWFPREILPLAAVGAQLIHFVLQLAVLLAGLAVLRHGPSWQLIPLLPVALLVLVLFTAALGMAAAAVNTFLRDTAHVIELGLLAGFWATPIVYPPNLVVDRVPAAAWLLGLNPVAAAVTTFQHALYNRPRLIAPTVATAGLPEPGTTTWLLSLLGVGLAISSLAFIGALALFAHLDDRFAEEV